MYALKDSNVARDSRVEKTALYPPPTVWSDTRYTSKEWKVLRRTGISNFDVVNAYRFMEENSQIANAIMLAAQNIWRRELEQNPSFTTILTHEFRQTLPMSLKDFDSNLSRQAMSVREHLLDKWVKSCQDVLLNAIASEEEKNGIGANSFEEKLEDASQRRNGSENASRQTVQHQSPMLGSINGAINRTSDLERQNPELGADEIETWMES